MAQAKVIQILWGYRPDHGPNAIKLSEYTAKEKAQREKDRWQCQVCKSGEYPEELFEQIRRGFIDSIRHRKAAAVMADAAAILTTLATYAGHTASAYRFEETNDHDAAAACYAAAEAAYKRLPNAFRWKD